MELHESTATTPAFSYGDRLYVRAPRPIHFPSEERPEEQVSETKRHLHARTMLYLLLEQARAADAVGSDQFVYWDAGNPKKCLSPDVFVKLGSKDRSFDSWKIWQRGAPDLAVEIVSDSDRSDTEWQNKLESYQASGIAEVVRFDPDDVKAPLRVWDSVDGELVERAPLVSMGPQAAPNPGALRAPLVSMGLQECAALGLWWVVADSDYGPVLRLARDREGQDLLPTANEQRLRLEDELARERRARTVAEHERMVAQHERMVAQHERKLADEARVAAEKRLLTEQETRQLAEREVDRLRAEIARLRGER